MLMAAVVPPLLFLALFYFSGTFLVCLSYSVRILNIIEVALLRLLWVYCSALLRFAPAFVSMFFDGRGNEMRCSGVRLLICGGPKGVWPVLLNWHNFCSSFNI